MTFRAAIAPVPPGVDRPLWSVMIPTHNCAQYLAETLESVLAQDPGPGHMQIEVVDDASDDDPEAVVRRVGRGRVAFHRQPINIGQVANFAVALNRSRGEQVHLLHGDDRVRPGFYAALGRGFAQDSRVGAAFCRWALIDDEGELLSTAQQEQERAGVLPDALVRLASEQRITTPSIAVRRSVWEQLGGFDARLRCAEDWEMWVRIAARHAIWYEPEALAEYRVRAGSTTQRNHRQAEEMRYTAAAMEMFSPLLPADRRAEVQQAARTAYASAALDNARRYAGQQDYRAMLAHLRAALSFSRHPRTLVKAALIAAGRSGAAR
jgi:hypothetical protein